MGEECVHMLEEAGIKATPNRILVLGTILEAESPLSMKEIEDEISTLDKSSIYRCLTLMRDRGLLQVIDSGSEGTRYEVLHNQHIHFYCESCGRTICLEDIAVPRISLPEGYEAHHSEHTVKGLCPDCHKKAAAL